jgi:GTPase SAR1 family protein
MSWDVGGSFKIRPYWERYWHDIEGLIFVIDCNDHARLSEVRDELSKILNDIKNIPILILANKVDLPNALTCDELIDALHLNDILRNRIWYLQSCIALDRDGLGLGLQWLVDNMASESNPFWLSTLDHSNCVHPSESSFPLLK